MSSRADQRAGVSGYLEVFLLIGVAVGGTGLVFGAVSTYSSQLQGPSVSVSGATARQGIYMALETLTVYNSGDVPFSSFTISTSGVSDSASYCYTLLNPTTRTVVYSSCAALLANPASVVVSSALQPGNGLLVEITVTGAAFAVGSGIAVTVTSSSGAQATVGVQVVPA